MNSGQASLFVAKALDLTDAVQGYRTGWHSLFP